MGRNSRLVLFIVACSTVGIALGGTAAQAQINQCELSRTPTNECLTQDPLYKTLEGMSVGLLAGAGAALGATFQLWQKNS